VFEVLMPLQHHASGNDCCGEGGLAIARIFDELGRSSRLVLKGFLGAVAILARFLRRCCQRI
jgi:hypothetical protein